MNVVVVEILEAEQSFKSTREIDCISPRKGNTHRHPRCLLLWAALRQGPERGNEREPVGGLDLSAWHKSKKENDRKRAAIYYCGQPAG
ncbi:hypothetical protein HCEG_05411 [Histoplasma capsulatum var. duboisii H88]|uniref:Uncharacterized protein n=1 Tax=Ajellomyces capsulatus (strain H88) TaxID=544711 RepID=F0ULC6_AJEC8|nr:hypothetical protein HCEG_05411 [Histoplasma capsulatum var. duboisii H88]